MKPDNILIDKKGNAKLCDFNLAREIGPRERMAGWLMTGGVGSYRYMVMCLSFFVQFGAMA